MQKSGDFIRYAANNLNLGSMLPQQWRVEPPPPAAIVFIYVDWLLQEIDMIAEEKWPILKSIHGWRRIEVIEFLESMPDWTENVLK